MGCIINYLKFEMIFSFKKFLWLLKLLFGNFILKVILVVVKVLVYVFDDYI